MYVYAVDKGVVIHCRPVCSASGHHLRHAPCLGPLWRSQASPGGPVQGYCTVNFNHILKAVEGSILRPLSLTLGRGGTPVNDGTFPKCRSSAGLKARSSRRSICRGLQLASRQSRKTHDIYDSSKLTFKVLKFLLFGKSFTHTLDIYFL